MHFIQHLAQDEAVEVQSRRVSQVDNAAAEVPPSLVAGHFSRATVPPLPLRHETGVYGRVDDLAKYYSNPQARYSDRPSANESLAMNHAAPSTPL